jgi:hypothetical protein
MLKRVSIFLITIILLNNCNNNSVSPRNETISKAVMDDLKKIASVVTTISMKKSSTRSSAQSRDTLLDEYTKVYHIEYGPNKYSIDTVQYFYPDSTPLKIKDFQYQYPLIKKTRFKEKDATIIICGQSSSLIDSTDYRYEEYNGTMDYYKNDLILVIHESITEDHNDTTHIYDHFSIMDSKYSVIIDQKHDLKVLERLPLHEPALYGPITDINSNPVGTFQVLRNSTIRILDVNGNVVEGNQ